MDDVPRETIQDIPEGYRGGKWGTEFKVFRRKLSARFVSAVGSVSVPASSPQRGERGSITGFSAGTGRRLRHTIDNHRADFRVMVTLTYPETFPGTGPICKGHLRALIERARRMGMFLRDTWVWWIEFQARGAPHFHLVSTGWVGKAWAARTWAEITGGNEASCTRVEGLRKPEAAGAYAAKYAAKQEQKAIPEGFKDIGRFWGMVGLARTQAREGIDPTPCLTAVLPRVSPDRAAATVEKLDVPVRAFETPIGHVWYGSERSIRRIWKWATAARSSVTTTSNAGPTQQGTPAG